MVRYVSATLAQQKFWLLFKIKSLLTSVRSLSHRVKISRPMKPYGSYLCSSSACRISLKWSKHRPHNSAYTGLKHEPEPCCAQAPRFYSTSGRETFRPEAPIGDYQNNEASFQTYLLQKRLGDSFKRLSRHINVYFNQKISRDGDVGQVGSVSAAQRGTQCQKGLRCQTFTAGTRETHLVQGLSVTQSEEPSLISANSRLQLFHISSLASRFGESYSYMADHINSMFSKSPAKQVYVAAPTSEDVPTKFSTNRKQVVVSQTATCRESGPHPSHSNTSATTDGNNTDVPSSWEEGYLHFARHINKYFGAKVTDTTDEPQDQRTGSERQPLAHMDKHQQSPTASQNTPNLDSSQNSAPIRPKSLFHLSNLSTRFGENYAYMATHINCYFKGSAAVDEEMERDPYGGQDEYRVSPGKPVSLFQRLLNPSTIPNLVASQLGLASSISATRHTAPEAMLDRVAVARRLAEEKTGVLLGLLGKAKTRSSFMSCVEELNTHLIRHPACKSVVWQEKAVLHMMKQRWLHGMDKTLQGAIRETLALIGYVEPIKGHGIRMLSIDGGGTRGVVPLQVLKQLEARTGKQVHQLFDYVCGVSTGAVLAFMLALVRIPIEECEEMYRSFGSDVFRQNPLVGTMKMGWTHSYYNTETWETILKEKMGDQLLIRTARDEMTPKVSAVSAVVNWGTKPKPFIFRNYNHSPDRLSRYAGGSGYQLWQAVRASSAAPGYFQEFPVHNDIHQDGGLILNNPCALAVHESRLLWPNQPFQCVLSLGTGRYDNARRGPATSTSLRAKISNLISSATDTEGVHTLLEDLLEPNVYFRFNPMLSADVSLDESRPGALQQLKEDTQHYLEYNRPKLEQLCRVLVEERTTLRKTQDWISKKALELQQRWV